MDMENYWSSKRKPHRIGFGISWYKNIVWSLMNNLTFTLTIPHYEIYKESCSKANLIQSKKYTPPIERNNGRQRHWLAVFRRRSIVVTRSLTKLCMIMSLFARFRINGSIDDLFALLKRISLQSTLIDKSFNYDIIIRCVMV